MISLLLAMTIISETPTTIRVGEFVDIQVCNTKRTERTPAERHDEMVLSSIPGVAVGMIANPAIGAVMVGLSSGKAKEEFERTKVKETTSCVPAQQWQWKVVEACEVTYKGRIFTSTETIRGKCPKGNINSFIRRKQ